VRRAPYRDTVERLANGLTLDDNDRAALRQAARRSATTAADAPRIADNTGAVPVSLSSFVGREKELLEVQRRLANNRLLTVTGPGGSGKTRLAVQVASNQAPAFKDGVVFVALAAIRDAELVASSIAGSLGIRDLGGRPMLDRLNEYLKQKSMLLVLDNFEQVLDAAPLVSTLLRAAVGVKVLVTSREPLRIEGEQEFALPALGFPEPGSHVAIRDLRQYGAVALFIDRAAAIKSDFVLSDANATAVVEICRRVDGLPLAIELAAARIRLLSPAEIVERLEHRLTLLSGAGRDVPARQQSIRATIEWSYDLLDAHERALLRGLSVFVGGCTLEAAECVVRSAEPATPMLDALGSLVSKNLVRQHATTNANTRFEMLETIREYGLEQLEASGELAMVRQRHATFFVALAEDAEPDLLTGRQVEWVRRLEADYDNLRAVMAWSRDGRIDRALGLRLAGALAWFWVLSGVAWEARGWVETMLRLPVGDQRARARALHAAARVAIVQDDPSAARTFADEAAALSLAHADHVGAGRALAALGSAESMLGDYAAARASLEKGMAFAQHNADQSGLAFALGQMGAVAEYEGDYETSRGLREESVRVARAIGDRHSLGIALTGLAYLARLRGDVDEAIALLRESLLLGTELGASWRVLPRALCGLAGVALIHGALTRAACLLGAADALWDASGKRDMPQWRAVFDADATIVRQALGDGVFGDAAAEGRGMRLEDVITLALGGSG
jgi:predicted ATPase